MNTFNESIQQYTSTGDPHHIIQLFQDLYTQECYHVILNTSILYHDLFKYSISFLGIVAACYYKTHQYTKSWDTYQRLLRLIDSDTSENNFDKQYYIQQAYLNVPFLIKKESFEYNVPFTFHSQPIITLTMTSCKRFDLFKRTVISLLKYVDVSLVYEWICIDDNSCYEDKEKMMSTFPFIRYIWKQESNKGHAKSMNILLQEINTPYFFHMEDDWQFYYKDDYIVKCLRVLQHDSTLGQCLININYAETIEDCGTKGSIHHSIHQIHYYIHDYEPNENLFRSKYGPCINCAYWPNYSLRPGLNNTRIIKEVGLYNIDADHFEMEFAHRYTQNGYKTAFLDRISCIHIGRLCKDRNDNTQQNAYLLNKQPQFHKPRQEYKLFYIVVNLDTRQDRWNKMLQQIQQEKEYIQGSEKFVVNRFSAINGYKLHPTRQLEQLFNDNDYRYRRGIIGCALSHMTLYCSIPQQSIYIIMEDDVVWVPNFRHKVECVVDSLKQQDWDILFIGHHLYPQHQTDKTRDLYRIPKCEKWSKSMSFTYSVGGTIGYIIKTSSATKILKYIQENGMTNAIDTMLQRMCDELDVYYCDTHLVYSEYVQSQGLSQGQSQERQVDSDIQFNYDTMERDFQTRYDQDVLFYKSRNIQTIECRCKDDEKDHPDKIMYCFDKDCWVHSNAHFDVHDYKMHDYKIDQVHVYIPDTIKEKYPETKDIGLMYKGNYSTNKLLNN